VDDELVELIKEHAKYTLDTEYSDIVDMISMDPDCYGVGLSADELEQFNDVDRNSDEEIALVYKAARHPNCPHIFGTALRIMDRLNEDTEDG